MRIGAFVTLVAVWLTKNTGTMQCAYIFAGIGIGSLVGVCTNNVVLAAVFGSISSYFLQLCGQPVPEAQPAVTAAEVAPTVETVSPTPAARVRRARQP